MPKDFSQALIRHLSSDYWQEGGAKMSILTPCELDFGLMKSTTVKTYLMTNDTSGCLRTDSM